jgi:hypothetical protein
MTALAKTNSCCKRQTFLSSERVPHVNKHAAFDGNNNLVLGLRWVLDVKIDWPTDLGLNITVTLTSEMAARL